jgi:O-antigen/teichoic acid export membrane protein
MKQSVRAAVLFSVLGNYGRLGIAFALIVIASRLLPPVQVGAFVVAYAIFTTLDAVRESGVTYFVVQAPEMDRPLLRSVCGVSILTSIPMAAAVVLLAPVLGRAFGGEQIGLMLQIMAMGFLLAPFTAPGMALLNRDLRFRELMLLRLASTLVRAALSISLLVAGFGVIALAWGVLASKAAELILFLVSSARDKIVPPFFRNLKPIFRFGLTATGAQVVSTLGVTMADLATGRFLGLASAGMYNRGAALVNLYRSGVEGAILPVAFSAFAREHRTEGSDSSQSYLRSLTLLTAFAWPAFALLGILAGPLILLLFGRTWLDAVPVAEILALGGAVYSLSALTPKLLVAVGRVETLLKRELLIQPPRIAMVLIAAQHSIEAVAWAIVCTYLLAFIVNHNLARSAVGITYQAIWSAASGSLVIAAASGIAAWLAAALSETAGASTFGELAAGISAGAAAWLVAIHLLQHPAMEELRWGWAAFRPRSR